MTDNTKPAAYILRSDGQAIPISRDYDEAAQCLAAEMATFCDFIQAHWPELVREEAIFFAAAITGGLPELFKANPGMLEALTLDIPVIKARFRDRSSS